MSIRNHLTTNLGATHLFMLQDANRDSNSSGITTTFSPENGSFLTGGVCEGVTKKWASNSTTDFSTRIDSGRIENTNDINVLNDMYRKRTVILWMSCEDYSTPTCIFEQGGGTNNFAFIAGLGKSITWQAADQDTPFIITQSKFQGDTNRSYFLTGIWEHAGEHGGTGNRAILYINGVHQDTTEVNTTDVFPAHSGDILVGNTAESSGLKTYNEGNMLFAARRKRINMLGFFNDKSFTEQEARDVFERSVKPDITINADTVANQQAVLDSLSGNIYENRNCHIRIIQATDATDYRLFIDNIKFKQDENLRDIAIQYVGPNTLTLENTNGSDVVEVSTPVEVDLDGTNILTGGGTINIVENTLRYKTPQVITNEDANKIVFETAGDYTISGGEISSVENISGGVVNVTLTKIENTPTKLETDGTINFLTSSTITLTGLKTNSEVRLYRAGTQVEVGGVENSTSQFSSIINEGEIDIVIFALGYLPIKLNNVASNVDTTIPIQQVIDRVYQNP